MNNELIRGVYAITPEKSAIWTPDAIVDCVAAALEGGVRLFQCRQKNWQHEELIEFVGQLNALCEKFDAALILNDVPALAFEHFKGAAIAGVHLGKPMSRLRRRVAPWFEVGNRRFLLQSV